MFTRDTNELLTQRKETSVDSRCAYHADSYYHILKEKVPYRDLGADYYSVINQEKLIQRNLRSLEKLGVKENKPAKRRAY